MSGSPTPVTPIDAPRFSAASPIASPPPRSPSTMPWPHGCAPCAPRWSSTTRRAPRRGATGGHWPSGGPCAARCRRVRRRWPVPLTPPRSPRCWLGRVSAGRGPRHRHGGALGGVRCQRAAVRRSGPRHVRAHGRRGPRHHLSCWRVACRGTFGPDLEDALRRSHGNARTLAAVEDGICHFRGRCRRVVMRVSTRRATGRSRTWWWAWRWRWPTAA